ncbi:MAG: DUF87 domain-containing protein [Candidatus Taylorbacteria bacterium]
MSESTFPAVEKKFSTPEEELSFLRGEVAKRESELKEKGIEKPKEQVISEEVQKYKQVPGGEVLHPQFEMSKEERGKIVLDLTPEEHDQKMSEFLGILEEKGIKNTLSIIEELGSPHLEDDFERFLVQYIKAGFEVKGIKEKDPLFRALEMTLYEITLPEKAKEENPKTLKELVSSMEQFYAGMLSVSDRSDRGPNYFTIELAVENHSNEFIFFAAVPDSKRDLFEKQVLSIFHNARISERKDDYNIFDSRGVSLGSSAESAKNPIFSLKTYDQFDHDPLNVVLNSFSKIERDGEGAAIQIVFKPVGDEYTSKYKYALERIGKGVKVKEAIDFPETVFGHVFKFGKEVARDLTNKKEKEEKEKQKELRNVDELVVEDIKLKIASPIVATNIRIVASAKEESRALSILRDVQSAFNQFENSHGNRLAFTELKKGKLNKLLKDFSFRLYNEDEKIPLSLKELTTMMHLPSTEIKSAPQLKISKAASAPAPIGLASTGILLGINKNRNTETPIYIGPDDRLRHFYTIGQTGTGKTTLLKNMIAQDIANGEGVCLIDPHGSDIQDVLAMVPKERYEDIIYFDPSYTARPMALNMLEYDIRFPEQKTFVVNEMLSIFNKLFDMKTAGGPMFEQYFRNAVLLSMEDPESGNTLLDVSRVLAQKSFRELKLSRCKNPIVVQFWREVAEKAGGEASLANIVPYITSKFDVFLSNDIMRPIIAQEKSSFNFRQIMDEKKILLVNLAKGRLGEINANLLGLILVGKILMAALSRVDSFHKNLPPFYLYIDEFQNVTTNSISTILSEARKYKLGLIIAHQFIAQLEESIRDSVFGNVGSIAAFRVGAEDAEYLEKQFSPVFSMKDLMNIDNRNAYLKLLSNGRPVKPFNIETVSPDTGKKENVDKLKELSYLKFGKERADVEEEIMRKYEKKPPESSL